MASQLQNADFIPGGKRAPAPVKRGRDPKVVVKEQRERLTVAMRHAIRGAGKDRDKAINDCEWATAATKEAYMSGLEVAAEIAYNIMNDLARIVGAPEEGNNA